MPRGEPRVRSLDEAQSKWVARAKVAKDVWASEVAKEVSFNNYIGAIAKLLGVDPEVVRGSVPASNWRSFQGKASEKKDKYVSGVEKAASDNKWKDKYRKAFIEKRTT
jgi:hypothetical protein